MSTHCVIELVDGIASHILHGCFGAIETGVIGGAAIEARLYEFVQGIGRGQEGGRRRYSLLLRHLILSGRNEGLIEGRRIDVDFAIHLSRKLSSLR